MVLVCVFEHVEVEQTFVLTICVWFMQNGTEQPSCNRRGTGPQDEDSSNLKGEQNVIALMMISNWTGM